MFERFGVGYYMRIVLLIFFIVSLIIMPAFSEVKFKFEGTGRDGVMTTYSILKEPRVEETGLSRGVKVGTFNYLDAREGGIVGVQEDMDYYYGNGTYNSGSWVSHTLTVNFEGIKGISEYYAKGFYNNNRVLSAWKKIRYEDTIYRTNSGDIRISKDYPTYKSPGIHVNASSLLDTDAGSYSIAYHADVTDGVVETKDETGWTNRTGAKRTDWEHESLSRGAELHITNDLSDYNLTTAAGGNDWLPCFNSGTIPAIEAAKKGELWPTQRMIKVLEADRIFPTSKMQRDYYFNSPSCVIGNCSNASPIRSEPFRKPIVP